MKPEKKPPWAGWHPVPKAPCTTLWLAGKKWKLMTSPATAPVTVSGVNTCPPCPTLMSNVLALARPAADRRARETLDLIVDLCVLDGLYNVTLLGLSERKGEWQCRFFVSSSRIQIMEARQRRTVRETVMDYIRIHSSLPQPL